MEQVKSLAIEVNGTRSGGLEPASSHQSDLNNGLNHVGVILHNLQRNRKQHVVDDG